MKIWLGYSKASPEWATFASRIPEAALQFDLAEQGSARWNALRLGIPTASRASDFITPAKGELSESRYRYGYELVAERLLNYPMATDIGSLPHIEEGKMREGEAREAYGAIVDTIPLKIGFMVTDDGRYGASPDSLLWLGQKRVGLEIKCPQPPQQVANWIDSLAPRAKKVTAKKVAGDESDATIMQLARNYRPQMMMQTLVGNLDRVDFFSHNPSFPPLLVEFNPDDTFIHKMEGHLRTFCDELDEWESLLRKQGVFAARAAVVSDADRLADALIADPAKMEELRAATDAGRDDVLDLVLATYPPEQAERIRHAIETGRGFG